MSNIFCLFPSESKQTFEFKGSCGFGFVTKTEKSKQQIIKEC